MSDLASEQKNAHAPVLIPSHTGASVEMSNCCEKRQEFRRPSSKLSHARDDVAHSLNRTFKKGTRSMEMPSRMEGGDGLIGRQHVQKTKTYAPKILDIWSRSDPSVEEIVRNAWKVRLSC